MAVVGDLEQFETAVFDYDFELGGSCVDRVFHQLLESVDWGDDDLAGCDLVDHIWM
jgi:hypothetical protein